MIGRRSWTRRGVASVVALSVFAVAVVVAAVVYDGYRAVKVLLDDASVWVFNTKADVNYIGRLNSQTKELDASVYLANLEQANIWQLADHVTVADGSGASKLDPVRVVIDPVNVASSGRVLDARGGVSVVVDQTAGAAWVGADDALSTFTGDLEPTVKELSSSAVGVVSGDGHAIVIDPSKGQYWVIDYDPRTLPTAGSAHSLGFTPPADARWTAVGDRPVAVEGNDVYLAGRSTPVTVSDDTLLVPQQPGARSGRVVVAGESGLWGVDLDSGEVDDLLGFGMGGAPAEPVVLGGCVHGAWAGNQTYAQQCGSAPAVTAGLDGVGRAERLVFRVNGRIIALNGADGRVFLVDGETLTSVTNWDEVIPKAESLEPISSTEDLQVEDCKLDSSEPPATTPDTYGAHPGQATRLPVLDNDHDANCDALTVVMPEPWDNAANGTLSVIDSGQAFQYQAPIGAKNRTVQVNYMVSDGAGHEVKAHATINITSSSSTPPRMIRASKAVVEQGKSIDYNILVDVEDPDGDLLSVVGSTAEPGQGRVEIASNGAIRYTATSDTMPGWRQVDIQISDGATDPVQQTLMVDVRANPTQIAPTVRNDYVVGRAGTEVVFNPLANDFDANGDHLSVLDLMPDDASSISTSVSPDGEVRLRAEEPGDYRLTYGADDGHESAFGVIRFTVRDAGDNEPPVAVSDRAAVQRGRSINAAVLGNDYDPDGDVLVVMSAENGDPSIPEVEVVVVDGRYVRVTAGTLPEPSRPIPITYWVTDGVHDPVAAQLLVQVTEATTNMKPVVLDDQRRVRAGDIATVDVLANDIDPDGDPLILTGVSIADSAVGGTVWLSGSKVRFLAGDRAGRVYIDYSVDDTPLRNGLHEVTGRLEIEVIAGDQGNSAPQPRPLEMRAFAGGTASVVVPLEGIDPDGDSVHFVGLGSTGEPGSTATKGEVSFVDGSLIYTAWPTSLGPDQFSYVVADAKGMPSASTTVRVTVVGGTNHSPSAVRDEITVRPNRSLLLPALANDSDPDGDALQIKTVKLQTNSEAMKIVVAEGVDGYLEVTVPGTGDYVATYEVTDGRGGVANAVIMVHADPDAPLLAPTARDDVADPAVDVDVDGMAVVDLLKNDDDPDNMRSIDGSGVRSDLHVTEIFPSGRGELVDGVFTVAQTSEQQLFVYTVTDLDDLTSKALVVIPAAGDALPRLRKPVVPIEVTIDEDGGSVEVRLDDHIIDPDGDPVEMFGSPVRVTQGAVEFAPDVTTRFTLRIEKPADLTKFEGSATLSVEVTDHPDDMVRSVRIDIPVVLTYTGFLPLRTEPATVEVEVHGQTSLNLLDAGFVIDPNTAREGTVVFSKLSAVGAAVADVSLGSDGELTATANDGAEIGDSAEYTYEVKHGEGDSFEGRLTVIVVSSTRPPPVAANLTFDHLDNDTPITTDVAVSAFNPFAEDGEPLKLVQVVGPEQSLDWGSVTWDSEAAGTEITFTPNSDFAGTVVLTYVIMDAGDSAYGDSTSGTPDLRRSTGTITYNLVGAPLQPPPPEIVAVRSKTVELSIDTSAENFWQGTAKDKDFIIEWAGHAPVHTNGETLVTIDGLPNNVEVQFTVTAVNEMGGSPQSDLSAKVRPDEVPPIPAAPRVVKEGDGQVTLEWDLITPGDFSPIEGYQLSVNHDGIVIPEVGASTNTQTITGLKNGQPYAFTLRARNKAETNGGWSEPSSSVTGVPYTVPTAPTEVSVAADPSALGSKVIVSWSPPDNDGGRPVQRYRVTVVGEASSNTEIWTTSPAFVGASLGDVTVYVEASNETDDTLDVWSARSDGVPFLSVDEPTAPVVNGFTEQSGAVVLDVSEPTDWGNTNPSARYLDYRLNGGSWQALPSDRRITGLSNCASYTVEVQARNEKYPTVGNSIAVSPYGPPSAPSVSGYASGQNIVWSWNSSSNGSCPMSVTVTAGGSTVSYSSSGSYTQPVGYSSSSSMNVTVSDGRNSVSGSASVSTGGAPPPPISVSVWQGNFVAVNSITKCSTTCRYVAINSSGWSPNQSLTYTCYSSEGSVGPWTGRADVNGNFSAQGPCWFAIAWNVYVVINGYTSNTVSTWRNW